MGPISQITLSSISFTPSLSPSPSQSNRVPDYGTSTVAGTTSDGKFIVVLGEDNKPAVMVRPPVGAPEDTLEVMPVNRNQVPTPDLLASDAVSLVLRNGAGEIIQPQEPVKICLLADRQQAGEDACLGFLDERGSGQWKCQDRCLQEKNNLLCGDTDHFTNFALLLTGGGGGGCGKSSWIFRESWKDGVLLGSFFGAALICIILIVAFSFCPLGSRCIRGKEGSRIHRLRHRNHSELSA